MKGVKKKGQRMDDDDEKDRYASRKLRNHETVFVLFRRKVAVVQLILSKFEYVYDFNQSFTLGNYRLEITKTPLFQYS